MTEKLESWEEPRSVKMTSAYLKRLLIERHAIRAALENPGGSIIIQQARKAELDALTEYSSVIGNDWHLDLLDALDAISQLSPEQQELLLLWCDGLTATQAAQFYSTARRNITPAAVKMRVNRTVAKTVEELNEGNDGGTTT